jgi:hypothetical protein
MLGENHTPGVRTWKGKRDRYEGDNKKNEDNYFVHHLP